MSGSKITAATLVNVVKFKTDRASLKAVRNDMKKYKRISAKQREL